MGVCKARFDLAAGAFRTIVNPISESWDCVRNHDLSKIRPSLYGFTVTLTSSEAESSLSLAVSRRI